MMKGPVWVWIRPLGQALEESDAEHGDGPSCRYTVWTSGAQYHLVFY